jgi:transposase
MSRKSALLDKKLEESARLALKKCSKGKLVVRKLEAIIAACKHGISPVAKIFDITNTTLSSWIKRFHEDEIEQLKAPPSRRRKSILNAKDRETILELVSKNSQLTGKMLCEEIYRTCGKKVSSSTMYRELKKLGYSQITPSPKYYKQDKD